MSFIKDILLLSLNLRLIFITDNIISVSSFICYYYCHNNRSNRNMGRKKKVEKEEEKEGFLSSLKEETVEGVVAILFIVFAIFLTMASFNKAGIVGEKIYTFFTFLFGIGYYLLPIILIVLGISFLKSLRHNLAIPKIIGGSFFLLSGLGLASLVLKKGGVVGNAISGTLVNLFDFWVSFIFLLALMTISILIVSDVALRISLVEKFLKRNSENEESSDEDVELKIANSGEEENEDEEKEDEEESDSEEDDVPVQHSEPAPKKSSGLIFVPSAHSLKEFKAPPLSILEKDSGKPGVGDIKANANIIKRTLGSFGINVEMDEISIGPSVTRYALKPAEGVKLARIVALQKDLSLALAAHPLRIEAPIPGKSLVGIEMPNSTKTMVGLGSLLRYDAFMKSDKPLMIALGKGVTGQPDFANIAKSPHMLIAGATGSGKSVTINALIVSLLYRNPPEMLKFIMVDPKRVELTLYNGIPHLLTPVITDAKKAILSLKWAAKEMDRRYDVLEKYSVRDLQSYHENVLNPALAEAKKSGYTDDLPETMPYIVVFIDELADIMQAYPRELESAIVRLAQMSRAVGIHLVLSTQRPSVNVITGLIKANIPTRIALQVASQIDSRTILDMPGAEKLLGAGDMLYLSGEMSQPTRLQSAFITETEVKKLVDYLKKEYADELPDTDLDLDPNSSSNSDDIFADTGGNDDGEDEDDLYLEAKQLVISAGKASTSYLQRRLRVGYARAARLIDILEDKGVVGPADGSKPREVYSQGKESSSESIESEDVSEESDDEDEYN